MKRNYSTKISRLIYDWNIDLRNAEVLVVNESHIRENGFSGRITSIVDTAQKSITLADGGNIGPGDFLLPAPTTEQFVYLASAYVEISQLNPAGEASIPTPEFRNIADSGALVKAKMINLGKTNYIIESEKRKIRAGSYISPLATAIVLDATTYLQTSGGGSVAHYFGSDEHHVIQSTHYKKTSSGSVAVVDSGITIPFAWGQEFYFHSKGSLKDTRDHAVFSVTGWIEP